MSRYSDWEESQRQFNETTKDYFEKNKFNIFEKRKMKKNFREAWNILDQIEYQDMYLLKISGFDVPEFQRRAVALLKSLSALRKLTYNEDEKIRYWVAENICKNFTDIGECVHTEKFTIEHDCEERTKSSIQHILSTDENMSVRILMASSSNTPSYLLENIIKHEKEELVIKSAKQNLTSRTTSNVPGQESTK